MLDTVNLNHIVTREGGWDTAADWKVRMMLDMIMIMVEIPAFSVNNFLLFCLGKFCPLKPWGGGGYPPNKKFP